MRSIVLSISGIALLALSAGGRVETWSKTTGPGPNRIINLYDAFGEKREGTVLDFGFSCLIVHDLGYFTAYPPNDEKPKLTGLPELSLSIETEAGQVLVVGCSHSSVGMMVEDARKQVGGEIDLVYGGYHLLPYDEATIRRVAREMRDEQGVKRAAPCHCTGPLGFKVFAEIYGEGFELAGLGAEVAISK